MVDIVHDCIHKQRRKKTGCYTWLVTNVTLKAYKEIQSVLWHLYFYPCHNASAAVRYYVYCIDSSSHFCNVAVALIYNLLFYSKIFCTV